MSLYPRIWYQSRSIKRCAALVAVRGSAGAIVHVAGVDVMQAVSERDGARAGKSRRRCGRMVHHLPVGMERGEVERHVGPELVEHPARELVELAVAVVLTGNEESRDLEPDVGLVAEVEQGVEHGAELATADLAVEALGECLEIDVGGVHVTVEVAPWLGADVAGGHRHRLDAELVAGLRGVDRVLEENGGVVVGERHAAAAEPRRGARQELGARGVHQGVHLARLRHVPVLTEAAGQIAAGGAEREDRRSRQEMVERLLLDRIDAEAARSAVGREHHLAVAAGAHEAQAALPVAQAAEPWADVALNATVVEAVPVPVATIEGSSCPNASKAAASCTIRRYPIEQAPPHVPIAGHPSFVRPATPRSPALSIQDAPTSCGRPCAVCSTTPRRPRQDRRRRR